MSLLRETGRGEELALLMGGRVTHWRVPSAFAPLAMTIMLIMKDKTGWVAAGEIMRYSLGLKQ